MYSSLEEIKAKREKERGGERERERERERKRKTDRQTDKQKNRRTDRSIERETDRLTDRQTEWLTDRLTNRQTGYQNYAKESLPHLQWFRGGWKGWRLRLAPTSRRGSTTRSGPQPWAPERKWKCMGEVDAIWQMICKKDWQNKMATMKVYNS